MLTFHRVVEVRERDHDISWSSFFRVLAALGSAVTTDLSLEPLGGKRVVLTFDDGSSDHAAVGRALAERNLSAVFFVPAATLGSPGTLSHAEIRELHNSGHVIASHGHNNIRFDKLTALELRAELQSSKVALESITGSSVTYLAPPGGSTHPSLAQELEQSGFSAARSVRWGIHRSDIERWNMRCIPVTELTIARRWVDRAVADWQLPLSMQATWLAKEVIPPDLRARVRSWTHHRSAR